MAIESNDDRVQAIRIVVNPDKLKHLGRADAADLSATATTRSASARRTRCRRRRGRGCRRRPRRSPTAWSRPPRRQSDRRRWSRDGGRVGRWLRVGPRCRGRRHASVVGAAAVVPAAVVVVDLIRQRSDHDNRRGIFGLAAVRVRRLDPSDLADLARLDDGEEQDLIRRVRERHEHAQAERLVIRLGATRPRDHIVRLISNSQPGTCSGSTSVTPAGAASRP